MCGSNILYFRSAFFIIETNIYSCIDHYSRARPDSMGVRSTWVSGGGGTAHSRQDADFFRTNERLSNNRCSATLRNYGTITGVVSSGPGPPLASTAAVRCGRGTVAVCSLSWHVLAAFAIARKVGPCQKKTPWNMSGLIDPAVQLHCCII